MPLRGGSQFYFDKSVPLTNGQEELNTAHKMPLQGGSKFYFNKSVPLTNGQQELNTAHKMPLRGGSEFHFNKSVPLTNGHQELNIAHKIPLRRSSSKFYTVEKRPIINRQDQSSSIRTLPFQRSSSLFCRHENVTSNKIPKLFHMPPQRGFSQLCLPKNNVIQKPGQLYIDEITNSPKSSSLLHNHENDLVRNRADRLSPDKRMHLPKNDSNKKPNPKSNHNGCNPNNVKRAPSLLSLKKNVSFNIGPKNELDSCSKFYDIGKERPNYSADDGCNLKGKRGKNSLRFFKK